MEDKIYYLALNMIQGLGSIRINQLLNWFGNAEEIFKVGHKQLQNMPGIGKELVQRIKGFKFESAERELKLGKKYGINLISIADINYPKILKEISDPPVVIYFKGNLDTLSDFNFAIVGSRRASFYGLSIAEKFAYQLASRGIKIVSGLARGIDSSAHRGALKAKGKTIAVLGSGLRVIYPPENKSLAEEIINSGVLISEFPLNCPPLRENFPRRNRIISGLSKGVLVVEAGKKSGALITADLALEQGRDVFAIPGKVDSPTSYGSNYLIKQGAKLVDTIDDILEEYGLKSDDRKLPGFKLSSKEEKILELLKEEELNMDGLILKTGFSLNDLNEILLSLEIKGRLKSKPGGFYSLR